MALKFEIIGNNLVVTETVDGSVKLERPAADVYGICETDKFKILTRSQRSDELLKADYTALVNASGTALDKTGLTTFFRTNLGFNKAGSAASTTDTSTDGERGLPTPVLIDDFKASEGYTVSNLAAPSLADSGLSLISPVNKVSLISSVASTGSIYKNTTKLFRPNKMGVISVLMYVSGQKTGRVLNMQDANGANGFNLIFSDNNGVSPNIPLHLDGWLWLSANVSEFPNFAALTAPQSIRPVVLVQRSGSAGNAEVRIDQIICNAAGRPKISFSFDDIRPGQYSNALPIFREFSVPGTIYVPTDTVGGANRQTLSMLREFRDSGFAICVNGTTDDTPVSTDLVVAASNLNKGRDYLVANGLAINGSENIACWPSNSHDLARAGEFSGQGMVLVRSTTGRGITDRWGLGDQYMSVPSYSLSYGTGSGLGSSAESILAQIDLAISRGQSFKGHMHDVVTGGAVPGSNDIHTSVLRDVLIGCRQRVDAGLADFVNETMYWDLIKYNQPINW